MDDKAVYLVSVDDGAENWQVIVFAESNDDAIQIGKEAYENEEGEPTESLSFGVTPIKPPYFWLG